MPTSEREVSMANNKRVLIIDDAEEIRATVTELLLDEGYDVCSAPDGRAALALLNEATELPGLILLDLMMPIMDGWSFRQAQLRDPLLWGIPVVVLSAAYDLRRQTVNIQAAAYLKKPVDMTKLISVVAYHYP